MTEVKAREAKLNLANNTAYSNSGWEARLTAPPPAWEGWGRRVGFGNL